MNRSRRTPVALLLVLMTSAALLLGGASRGHNSTGYDPARNPKADLQAAVATAQREHKRILMVVGGDWCGWCQELASTLRDDALDRQIAASYVLLKVNYSPANPNRAFLARFPQVAGYPHIFVLESSGRLLYSEDTDAFETEDGYDCTKISAFLQRWAPSVGPSAVRNLHRE